jgi:hypothetical protein
MIRVAVVGSTTAIPGRHPRSTPKATGATAFWALHPSTSVDLLEWTAAFLAFTDTGVIFLPDFLARKLGVAHDVN